MLIREFRVLTLSRNSTASSLPFVAACINGVRPKRSLDSTFAPPAQNVESRISRILADHLTLSQTGGGQIISPLRIFRSSYGPEFYILFKFHAVVVSLMGSSIICFQHAMPFKEFSIFTKSPISEKAFKFSS